MKFAVFEQTPTWRIIAARHPPIHLFESVASADEFDALYELEAAFSPHYSESMLLPTLPRSEWVFGPGAGYIMAPFVYRTPTRFSNGSFGVYYAGLNEETAILEVAFHRSLFMAATHEPPSVLEQQVLRSKVTCNLVDIRGQQQLHPEWYRSSPEDYGDPQTFGMSTWQKGHEGLTYSSVRSHGGECVAIFRPKAVSNCRHTRPLRYIWDGQKIAGWS